MTLSQADIDSLLGPEPTGSVESLLDAPLTGEDISLAMQDTSYKPTKRDFIKYEEYSKTKQTDWLETAATAVDGIVNIVGSAASQGVQGAGANPRNYIEAFVQGTRQLYGLAAQAENPSSPLFRFKDLITNDGTAESRYQQFLDAREFGQKSAQLERGETGVAFPPELTNPEFVQGLSIILDPTLFIPGFGEMFGMGKLATRAVGKGAQLTGRAVAGAARPLERFAGAAERIAAETIGTTPEAFRNVASTAGIAGALGIAPEAAAFAAIPAGIRTAREAGEALSRAGENLMTQPSRVGPLEAIGAAPGANLRQRMLGVIGQYGGDAAVDFSLRGLAGGIEGAALGTGLGYLSGGEEGAAAGLGSGGVQGVAGALGGRAYQKLTGKAAKEARAGDLGRFIDAQQDPTTKALFQQLRDRHGVDAASSLMDLQGLVRGKFGDVEVEYLSSEDFAKRYKINARGVQVENKGGRPAVVINADIIGKGAGDGPLYTLGHELFHALEKSTQLEAGATEIKNALVGRWIQEGDTIRKLAEGAFNDAEIEAKFNEYRDKLGAGNASMADELAKYDTVNKKADYVASELAAEHFAALLAGQKPDALLKGFTGLTRQLLDLALTQNASRALADAAATIERTFGVKPTDSVLFPDLKQASPQVNAMLRDLLRARRKLDEKIKIQGEKTKLILKPEDVSNPLAAKQLVELGLAEQMPDGTIRSMSSEEVVAREDKDRESLRSIIENTPGTARMVDGVAQGRLSPEQLSAIEQSQAVSSRMKDKIRAANAAMDAGNSLNITYSAALKKIINRLTGKKVNRYSSGIRLTDRDVLPYAFYFSKSDHPLIKAIDISYVRDAILKDTASNGSVGNGLWDNVDGFMGDLAKYFTNLDQKEGARRSAEIFGLEKAKYLGDFINQSEKFVRDFRLDRIGSIAPSGFRARFSEDAYQLSKNRWMPAETVGDKSVINSEEGYRIISGAKHRLYGPDGKLLGIYDTQTQAERKADATQTRLQPEVRQQQRPLRDEGRQATEAGGRNRIERGQEGQGQGGAVRQEGDVITPESPEVAKKVVSGDTSALKDGELLGTFRFMPPDLIDKLAVTDQQRKAMRGKSGFAFVSDWADAGRPYVTRLGRNIDVLMGGMGYPFLPEISDKGAWAGTFSTMTDRVMDKIKATDGIGLVVLGGPESSASSRAFSRAFGEELADSMSQNPKLKEKLDAIARDAREKLIEYRRGKDKNINVPEINNLDDWARFTQLERVGEETENGLTFEDRAFLVRTIGAHDNKKALGIRSWKDVLRNYNLQNKDFTPGQVVAVVQFSGAEPVRAETIGAKPHPSYEALIPGKAIGTLPKKTMIKDVFRKYFASEETEPPSFTRKVQTAMPEFVVGKGDMRFMPSSLTARDINAIASEVGGGDVKGGAKAFGAFMRSMRDKGITLRDVVKSYGITLSSIQRQELPVSTIKKNWPDAPFQEGTKVRPEDAFAQLLGTPEGQKYLDAAESGVFDEQAADAVVQKFRSFGFHNKLKEQMKTAVEQFYPKAQEIIDAVNTMPTDKFIDYVRNNFKGISYGKVGFWSGQLGRGDIPTFDSRQGKLVYGKEVPVTKQVLMEQKDRLTQLGINVPAAFKDFAQTLLHHEVWDRLNQSDTEHGPIKEAMLRYMPSDTDYLSAVKQGDTQAAQRMVDEAAKAAGYTIGPVYHGTPTGGFNVFDKRMRGETSGVSRQAFSFTTDKKAAEGYSKRLGDEAVRLDAGLRVANDAMRRFDDDVAAQEYFSSKGYSSVNDGMLPEFDWGSIDDVPEFIKELRGHAKDLKPINADLASSFVDAAKVMASTKAVPEVKRVFLRIPENAPVFQATPATLGQVMSGFSAEKQPTKAGIVELPGNERIYYVADSSQVKLADPVTKDSQGNVIPLSQRFKTTSEDIRYMPAGDMASGRSVKDHREAMDLFEKGYRLYGALYDGMEDPIRLKKASEIEKYDPENLWAVPSKKIAAAISIRNMPAGEQDIKALQMLPKPRRSLDAAYQDGAKTRSQDPQYYDVPDYIGYDMARTAAFEMGREGAEPPRWVMAERIGKLPTEGRSKNFAEDKMERGVSVLRIVGEPQADVGTYEMFNPGEKRYVAGWLVGLGSDGEPLLADAVDLGLASSDVRMMPSPDSAMPGAYSFPGGYRALPGKAKGSLRLYGPAGSLIGIASSLDEAQRILRRKNK